MGAPVWSVMMFHKNHTFWLLSLLFLITGCTIFSQNSSPPPIVDPVVERARQWQKLIETGNNELKQGDLRAALAAYETAITIRPNASETQRKIAEIYYQLEEYENARHA
ncbi:tetratricopeptide repeat protein, partial [Candidatus Poribacteria bacterium]|nr:tetratricopeptide repeat protein [Candidatus Poribacteria bacterium]